MDTNKKIACVIPWNSPFLWAKPITNFLNLHVPDGVVLRWFMANGWCSARRKTVGVEQAMAWGADYVWFIDADQLIEENTLKLLWQHVIDGHCPIGVMQPARGYFPQFKGMKPYQPVCWDEQGKVFTPDKLQSIMYGSLNCVLIPITIFKTLARPWFTEKYEPSTMARLSSLDQHFTKRLWDNYTPLWVDPLIRPKHLDAVPLDWTFQDRFDDVTTMLDNEDNCIKSSVGG